MKILNNINTKLSPFSKTGREQLKLIRDRKNQLELVERYEGKEAALNLLRSWQ